MTEIGAPSVLLEGAPGSGKTTSIATLLKAGIEVFVIVTEPNGLDSLLDAVERTKAPIDKLHWCVILPSPVTINVLKEQAKLINTRSYEDLTKIKGDPSKRSMLQWMKVLDTLENFHDERTGQNYGNIGEWGPDRALVIDSLSGLNTMARDWNVGAKPMMHEGEYGVAMHMIQRLVNTCTALNCIFVLTAHIDRTVDPIRGGTTISLLTLGKKYTPPLPAPFSEVIHTMKDGAQFWWSTATTGVDTKNRALPLSDKLKPDFEPIIQIGKRRADLVARAKQSSKPGPSTETQTVKEQANG